MTFFLKIISNLHHGIVLQKNLENISGDIFIALKALKKIPHNSARISYWSKNSEEEENHQNFIFHFLIKMLIKIIWNFKTTFAPTNKCIITHH